MPADLKYRRVLLKISGEALMGEREYGQDPSVVARIAAEVKQVHALGVEVCMVIGGGNIFRGLAGAANGIERATADYMGMLATVINSLAMQSALERLGVTTRVLSAISMQAVCEPYIRRRAIRHMEKGRAVIFAAGTGNPFFTTDTAAALRASEMGCDALLKGTKVDGVYSADPKKVRNAERYDRLRYRHKAKFPVVCLKSESYQHTIYGKILKPVFRIVDWTYWDDETAADPDGALQAQNAAEMNDEIPF